VTFESDSKLSRIAKGAFWNCASLSSICIPGSLRRLLHEYAAILTVCD
jgi:hypothetical protein